MKWKSRPAQDSFLKKDLLPLSKCLRSAGICFLGYNGYELPVKHMLEISVNHNSELDKRQTKKNEGKTSVLCAGFCKCKKQK